MKRKHAKMNVFKPEVRTCALKQNYMETPFFRWQRAKNDLHTSSSHGLAANRGNV